MVIISVYTDKKSVRKAGVQYAQAQSSHACVHLLSGAPEPGLEGEVLEGGSQTAAAAFGVAKRQQRWHAGVVADPSGHDGEAEVVVEHPSSAADAAVHSAWTAAGEAFAPLCSSGQPGIP